MTKKTNKIPAKKRKPGRPKKVHPGGRPTKYLPQMNEMVYELCSQRGYLRGKIAKILQISRETIYQWEKDYPEFSDSITKGMDDWNNQVIEKSLITRAKGFRYTETTKELLPVIKGGKKDKRVENKLVVTKTVRKMVIPDVPAIKHWQTNRDPDRWQDRRVHELGGKDGAPIPIAAFPSEPMSLAEWEKQMAEVEEARKLEEPKQVEAA